MRYSIDSSSFDDTMARMDAIEKRFYERKYQIEGMWTETGLHYMESNQHFVSNVDT